MKHVTFTLILLIAFPLFAIGQDFTITASDRNHISLHFELGGFSIDTVRCNGELMHSITTKGIVVPNEYGQPNLPTFNRFIAIPQGAKAIVEVSTTRDERMTDINIVPSVGSQAENDPERPFFKDQKVYAANTFYPAKSYLAAEPQQLRGVDVIHLGLSPFQFNPVTRELAVHRTMDIDIRFEGGNGHFSDDRLRSRYWDPILQNNILNYDCLEPIDYDARMQQWTRNQLTGCEYLILTPDNDAFEEAAQELADYRTRQGILTKVMRINETGVYTFELLKLWFQQIYANWDIPPAAVCIIGESGTDTQQYVPGYITPHPKDGTIVSDNPYADVNEDGLPDICFTRLIAQNESELPIFIGKQIEYETDPVMSNYYYSHPLTAAGWQTSLWFQITIATISGYLTQHGKSPVRINEIYNGELGDVWSTASGTSSVISYFGPEGHGYIPATPGELGGWTGGTADDVIRTINNGAYLVQHRDHGWNTKWFQPEIHTSDFDGINNPGKMSYLISVNCRTGMYNEGQTCFTEGLIRMKRDGQNAGIVGAIAPTGQTYSFANDIFLWGVWDLFDSNFLPEYGPFADHFDTWMPAFANVSGKYFLETHVFPSTNEEMCTTTYKTFHTHGDAFLRIFTEIPQPIDVSHDPTISCFTPFHITAPEGTQIALSTSHGGQLHILATAIGTGQDQTLNVMEPIPGGFIRLTITGQNLLRHEEDIMIQPINRPFVVVDSININGEGLALHYNQSASADITIVNIGTQGCQSGTATLTTDSEYLNLTQGETSFAALAPQESQTIEDAFRFDFSDAVPDGTQIPISITTRFNGEVYEREYYITALSPNIAAQLIRIDDTGGDQNGLLDPGEYVTLTFRLINNGHYLANHPHISLHNEDGYIRVVTPEQTLNDMEMGQSTEVSFEIYVEYIAGAVANVDFTLRSLVNGLCMEKDFGCPIGFVMESFEIGEFNPDYWTTSTEHPWVITDTYVYDGNYCAKSGIITHDESSQLDLSHTSIDGGIFSFYAMVSSENGYDFLVFYIDDLEQDRWSGEQGWQEHSYEITPGYHTFTWLYTKDYSVDGGLDDARIDYIMLPPHLDKTDEQADLPLTLHPNPTSDQITIDMEREGDFEIQVFDANGKRVITERNAKVVSLKGRPSGMYHIVVEQNGQRWSQKIIKL